MVADTDEAGKETGKERIAVKNPALVLRVVKLREQGKSITQIGIELGLSRPTVRKYLATAGAIAENCQQQIESITQAINEVALKSIEAQIRDRNAPGDGRLALDWMKLTVFAEKQQPHTIQIDARVQAAFAMLSPARAAIAAPVPAITGDVTGDAAPRPDGASPGDNKDAAPIESQQAQASR